MTAPEPVRFGQYTVTRILGRGALGRVYHGEDPLNARQVAVRVIRGRVEDALRAVPRLSHPGIIPVYDVGGAGRHSFVAMEFAPGGSLEDQLESGVEYSPARVADLVVQIADALDYAHGQGLIHQDVRPANIMLAADGHYKLTDFKIDDVTEAGQSNDAGDGGRPYCLSPEQVRGLPVTPSTDQFSLAATVYRLLTGMPPFEGDTAEAITFQISEIEPPSPSHVNPRLSPVLSQVVMRALSKDPGARYPSCRAFADALLGALGGAETGGATDSSPGPHEPPAGGATWDDTVLAAPAGGLSADLATPVSETGLVPPPPVARRSRFTTMVVAVVVVVVGVWLAWTMGLLGPTRIDTTLAVGSNPPDQSLEIWIDDLPIGLMTPAEIPIEGVEGQSIRLDLIRDDEVVASTSVTLAEGMVADWTPEVEVPLRPVRYEVRSDPTGALVRLDGQEIARPTPVDVDLFPGQSYDIEVELEGYEPTRRTVDPSGLAPEVDGFDFSLARIVRPGRLFAQASFPVTVVVRADGEEHRAQGRSPSLELPPGSYTVSVTAPEVFFAAEADVTVREGEDVSLPDIPTAVKVLVFDVPGNAMVRVDDFAPFPSGGPRTVVMGPHRFIFEWPTGESFSREIDIERDGQEVSARQP